MKGSNLMKTLRIIPVDSSRAIFSDEPELSRNRQGSYGRDFLASQEHSCRVTIIVRPFCRAVGTQEKLGKDVDEHLLREGELTQLCWQSFRLTEMSEVWLFAYQSHAENRCCPQC